MVTRPREREGGSGSEGAAGAGSSLSGSHFIDADAVLSFANLCEDIFLKCPKCPFITNQPQQANLKLECVMQHEKEITSCARFLLCCFALRDVAGLSRAVLILCDRDLLTQVHNCGAKLPRRHEKVFWQIEGDSSPPSTGQIPVCGMTEPSLCLVSLMACLQNCSVSDISHASRWGDG